NELNDCNEGTLAILVDIYLDWIGLKDFKNQITKLGYTGPFQESLDSISKSVKLKDWKQVVDLLFHMFGLLLDKTNPTWIQQKLGKKNTNQLLKALSKAWSIRLVPFVGWAFCLISLGVSIYSSKDRLVALYNCKKE
ncbi:hypothetical protein, partial [Shewanella sp. MBTL60-007]|uniref:hypothetical protein n=1 Tax=Shewanella sp. MBTL60-007 TaxID=2815911 RepID=UPI001C7F6CE8